MLRGSENAGRPLQTLAFKVIQIIARIVWRFSEAGTVEARALDHEARVFADEANAKEVRRLGA